MSYIFEFLKKDTKLSQLSNMVDDPESPGKDVYKVIFYTIIINPDQNLI